MALHALKLTRRVMSHNLLSASCGSRCSSSKPSVKQALQQIANLPSAVTVQGWVKAVRQHKDLTFLHISDGSSLNYLQIVTKSHNFPLSATYGSCVRVVGTLVKSEKPQQPVEVISENIEVLGGCNFKSYPFKAHTKHSLEYTRQYVHLRPRTAWFGAVLRIRNAASMAIHRYFQDEGFCYIQTPILTSNDCEGAGEIFTVEPADHKLLPNREQGENEDEVSHFFGVPSFLTVSGQLHLEVVNGAFAKVYSFGPTFRAENSRTRHHLSEFNMIEAELSFTQSLDDLMTVIEGLVTSTTKNLLASCASDIEFVVKNSREGGSQELKSFDTILAKPFLRLSYTEAIRLLEQHSGKFQNKVSWGIDLYKEHERFLVDYCGAGTPVFVTDYPSGIKPFYARVNDDKRTVAAVDLLASGVGEICGGSLREERLDILESRLSEKMVKGDFDWYLDLRRFGSAPHGGFGIGFERFLQTLLGVQNIKDMIPFPRSTNSCRL